MIIKQNRLKAKAFTLIEIMLVITILVTLAAIAIPSLLRAFVTSKETTAIAALKTILTAEIKYRATNPVYASLETLGGANYPYLDSKLGCSTPPCKKQNYLFNVTPLSGNGFFAVADPEEPDNYRTFYIDESGVICRSNTTNTPVATAHANSSSCPPGYDQCGQ
ncbi:MAG: type II secretion system protein [Candidatus Omnitrophica bacterium]|nr:type II secretion system protein [Candidatus Omnitrophota bacterium]